MSSHHRNRSCNPCFICGLRQLRYDHYCTYKPAEQKFLQRHIGREIPSHACLCRAHHREAQRHKSDPEYVPIWKTASKGSKPDTPCMTCNYPGCSNTSSSARIIVPSGEIQLRFCEALGYQHCSAMGVMHVCETHYQHLYRQVHALNPCAGCGAKPKVRQGAYTRHSPDPVYISQYLTQTTGFEVDLTPTDTICKACYDMHLVIQQNIQVPTSAPSAQLQSDLVSWTTRSSDETTDELTRAVLTTVIFVGTSLQQDRALLLPQAVTVFTENYHQGNGGEDLCLELRDGSVTFSARWLMNQLITHLEPYMSYKCTVKRLGTLLYPRNGNTLRSLSLALHKSHADSTMQGEQYVTPPLQNGHDNSAHVLREAGNILNNIIHDEIRRLKASDIDLTMFSLMDSIRDANQPLWEFVCSCTRSVRERTGRSDADQTYLKTLRRFFIICMLLFATNPSCDTTMHHLVADRVEVCGGSRELIRTLNRLGVCVSPDTHDRLVTSVAEQEKGKNLWDDLCRDTFIVNTIDNCDFGQRHAAVYCGDQSRSYHGTTVQLVQPVPSLKVDASNSVTTPPATPTYSSLQNPHSPENEHTTGANLATKTGKSSLTNHPTPQYLNDP